MTTEITDAEAPARPDRYPSVEDMILAYHPEWDYLVNATLDVRPPTAEEAAGYAARATDADWADIYNPAPPPRPVPTVHELEAATADADQLLRALPSPQDAEAPAGRNEAAEARIQHEATQFLLSHGAKPEDFPTGPAVA